MNVVVTPLREIGEIKEDDKDADNDVFVTMRLLSSRRLLDPKGGASGKKGSNAAAAKPPDPTSSAIRAALVRHERAALSEQVVARDPDRYAAFLSEGVAMVLDAYASSVRSAMADAARAAKGTAD